MRFGKLWSLHLNDQNGLKFDQDKPFGSANLRVAFNQVRALERNGYGESGEYVCFDVHPFRTTKSSTGWRTWTTAAARSCVWSKRRAPSTLEFGPFRCCTLDGPSERTRARGEIGGTAHCKRFG